MASNFDMNEQSAELFEAQSHVWHHAFSFISSLSLKCATELGIADAIHKHGGPISLDELVSSLNISAAKSNEVYRLMRVLIHSGFFKKGKLSSDDGDHGVDEGYVLTPSSLLLVESHPYSLKPFVLSQIHPFGMDPCHSLAKWFRSDDGTASLTTYGTNHWEKKESEPEFSREFDAGMASDTRFLISSLITRECNKRIFEGLNSIVDVGGGTGTLARVIADTFPHIDCTVLDLPHVVEGLEGTRNLKFVGGNMFDHIPPADAILMKWILHDWNDKEAVDILKKCKEAITSANKTKKGKLIILEMTIDEEMATDTKTAYETHLFLDMLMMTLFRAKERTKKEWGKLFFDAGFSDYKISHLSDIKSVIEVFP